MSPALPDNNPPDRGATPVTGLIGPLVNLKLILEFTAAVNPIDAGAVGFDPRLEHVPDTFQQDRSLRWG